MTSTRRMIMVRRALLAVGCAMVASAAYRLHDGWWLGLALLPFGAVAYTDVCARCGLSLLWVQERRRWSFMPFVAPERCSHCKHEV